MTLSLRRYAFTLILAALLGAAPFTPALGQVLAEPDAPDISAARVDRLDAVLEDYVEEGELPGAVALVMRGGEVIHLGAYGWRDMERRVPMTADTIFRIASQTKALVSVGILMLQEEGKLLIGDPLDRYFPEYAETTVAVPDEDDGYEVVPAKRKITLRDLLTHISGIGYGYGAAAEEWAAAGIQGWYFADRDEPIRETVRRMAALPFDAQPGEQWVYGYSVDILGAVIEVASGQPLDAFLRERLFEPLGMVDTYFYLPRDKADRLATVYARTDDGSLQRSPDASDMIGQGGYVEGPRASFSGGAGLLSTARDYARFLQMMLNGGTLDGRRILSRKSVELMTVNHLPEAVDFPWQGGVGFGLGFSVTLDVGARGVPSSVGEYGWGGAYHSAYWIDPAEDLIVTYFAQVIPANGLDDHGKLRALAYQALE